MGGRVAVDIDDADLAVVAALVLLQEALDRDRGGRPLVQVGQGEALVGHVRLGLGGDGTDPCHGRRDGRSDGQELRGHGHAPGGFSGDRIEGLCNEGERHASDPNRDISTDYGVLTNCRTPNGAGGL